MVLGEGLHHLLQAPVVLQGVVALRQSLLIPALYIIGHCLLPVHNNSITQITLIYSDTYILFEVLIMKNIKNFMTSELIISQSLEQVSFAKWERNMNSTVNKPFLELVPDYVMWIYNFTFIINNNKKHHIKCIISVGRLISTWLFYMNSKF